MCDVDCKRKREYVLCVILKDCTSLYEREREREREREGVRESLSV